MGTDNSIKDVEQEIEKFINRVEKPLADFMATNDIKISLKLKIHFT